MHLQTQGQGVGLGTKPKNELSWLNYRCTMQNGNGQGWWEVVGAGTGHDKGGGGCMLANMRSGEGLGQNLKPSHCGSIMGVLCKTVVGNGGRW